MAGPKEPWSVHEERPLPRRTESSYHRWVLPLVIVILAAAAGSSPGTHGEQPAPAAPAPRAEAPRAPKPAAEPAIRNPLQPPAPEAAKSLPTLENSDSMMRNALAALLGKDAFARLMRA